MRGRSSEALGPHERLQTVNLVALSHAQARTGRPPSGCQRRRRARRLLPPPALRSCEPAQDPYLGPGTEMALHDTLAERLRMDILFCDPHCRRQHRSASQSSASDGCGMARMNLRTNDACLTEDRDARLLYWLGNKKTNDKS